MQIFAGDVDYHDADASGGARAALVVFDGWSADHASWETTLAIEQVAPYESGAFYKRELPCWLALIEHARAAGLTPDLLVVDGYACFGPGRPALGEHLLAATGTPVVGVAKTRFATATHVEVLRGASRSPLYITAVGTSAADAALHIRDAHGSFRVPTLLRRVDALARGLAPPLPAAGEVAKPLA